MVSLPLRMELGAFICFAHPVLKSIERKAICRRFQVPGHHIHLLSCSWVIHALLIVKLGTSSQEIKAFVPKENSWPEFCVAATEMEAGSAVMDRSLYTESDKPFPLVLGGHRMGYF